MLFLFRNLDMYKKPLELTNGFPVIFKTKTYVKYGIAIIQNIF